MKLIKICLSIFLVGLTSLAMAVPAKVGGAEVVAELACPALPPPTCPPGNSCNACSICVEPSPCEICEPPPPCQNYSVDFLSNLAGDLSTKVVIDQSKAKDLGCFETIVNKSLDALRDDMQWYDADWGTYSILKMWAKPIALSRKSSEQRTEQEPGNCCPMLWAQD